MVILPGERCVTPDGAEVAYSMGVGVRTWGNSPDGVAIMLVGVYEVDSAVSQRLLRALPALLTLPATAWDRPLDVRPNRFYREGRVSWDSAVAGFR